MRLVLEELDLALAEHRLIETAVHEAPSLSHAAALLRITERELRARMRRLGISAAELPDRYALVCRQMRAVLEMPDRLEHLFIRLCLSHGYKLPADRRVSRFAMLTDDEIARLERAVHEGYTAPLPTTTE